MLDTIKKQELKEALEIFAASEVGRKIIEALEDSKATNRLILEAVLATGLKREIDPKKISKVLKKLEKLLEPQRRFSSKRKKKPKNIFACEECFKVTTRK
jgi:hypothetical protein